ncbi:hypothetical protein [Shouchella lonarensis]|uniref:Lipid A biosynthesis acyltransferase n=1 Tax=Shouchella lonarensis TaxID=1464122 RepID=A0A1G6HPC2_9BACI|nr:hypothetical protein [Shouchella lonarensis]SDB96034.1 hypothetical protein SAMN05421737_104106 [Shouchella lonarensis]
MGKIESLDFIELGNHPEKLVASSKQDLYTLCYPSEKMPVPSHYADFVRNDTVMLNNFRSFVAHRPFHWAWFLRLLKIRGLDESFLEVPGELSYSLQNPCIVAIPHFGLHMLVPHVLGHFIRQDSMVLATGNEEGEGVQDSIEKILPNDRTRFLKLPDRWILRKLMRGYQSSHYPVIYPDVTSSGDKRFRHLSFLETSIRVPLGVENLSRLCKCPVLPVAMTYHDDCYRLHLGPTLVYKEEGSIIFPLFSWIEELVHLYPDQWFGWNFLHEMIGEAKLLR